jgi:hypothetical protein
MPRPKTLKPSKDAAQTSANDAGTDDNQGLGASMDLDEVVGDSDDDSPGDDGSGGDDSGEQAPAETGGDDDSGAAAEAPLSFLDQLAAEGFEGVADEADAQARILESHRQLREQNEQLQRMQPYAREHIELYRDPAFQAFMAQRQQPAGHRDLPQNGTAQPAGQPQQPAQETPAESWWNPPKVDQRKVDLYREIREDENGNRKVYWADDTPLSLRSAVAEKEAYHAEWAAKLVNEPDEAFESFYKPRRRKDFEDEEYLKLLDQRIDARFGRVQEQQTEQQFLDQLGEQNPWLWKTDPRTQQPLINPVTHQAELSPQGQRAFELTAEAEAMGIKSPQDQWRYAERMLKVEQFEATQGQQTQGQQTQQRIQDQRQKHLRRGTANGLPSRGGSIPNGTSPGRRPQNPNLSFGHSAAAALEQNGLSFE